MSNLERYQRCLQFGDVTGNGVVFDWGLAGPGGAWFTLFREPFHTKEDIDAAKRWLRQHRDVVSILVVSLEPPVRESIFLKKQAD